VVGACWIQFWLKDTKLEDISSKSVRAMVERYEDCVPASNPDYYSIKKLLDMLNNKHEYKEVSRYDFLNQVRLTLRESSCMKV
jgi:hypothetical protein